MKKEYVKKLNMFGVKSINVVLCENRVRKKSIYMVIAVLTWFMFQVNEIEEEEDDDDEDEKNYTRMMNEYVFMCMKKILASPTAFTITNIVQLIQFLRSTSFLVVSSHSLFFTDI